MIHHQVSVNGVSYHLLDNAQVDRPLVLLHGFTGSTDTWSDQMARFAASQYAMRSQRIMAIDLLGHGKTESPDDPARYAIEAAAADLIALFDHLKYPEVDLLGYSMGGRLALFTALTYPDRIARLLLESASPGIADAAERTERLRADQALADRIEREGLPAFVDYWENLPLFAAQKRLPAEVQAQVRAGRLANNPKGLANSLRGMGTGAQPSLWENLSALALTRSADRG
ncbi:MAG: 2-succinyl-6-hydroxy-2,4-cyclohexadiene-1-carboxylate synthase [Anaerolineae bacterium]